MIWFNELATLRKKKMHFVSSGTFWLPSSDLGTIPLFVCQKRIITIHASHRIYDRTKRAFLYEQIHGIRRDLTLIDTDLPSTQLLISNSIS